MLTFLAAAGAADPPQNGDATAEKPLRKHGPANVIIGQHIQGRAIARRYPYALPTLIEAINDRTTIKIHPHPALIDSFEDPALFRFPFIYVNFADRADWTFSPLEQQNLKQYLERGGFIFVDAGINAEFLRSDTSHGQHHSFAEWQATPALSKAFNSVFPGKTFAPMPRSHPIFSAFHKGLPDASQLPDQVRDFVVNEKWPQGTYSAVALTVKGRIAVLATPIIAMGWGRNQLGTWNTTIRFRVRENHHDLSQSLETAAYDGARFETTREDGQTDVIYCQQAALPGWVREPDGKWRIFKYYPSREISDFAHVFYTQLGINFVVYALTN